MFLLHQKVPQAMTYPEFFWADQYIHRKYGGYHNGRCRKGKIYKICASKCSKNALPGRLFLAFFVKYSPNYWSVHYETPFFKIHIFKPWLWLCMAINSSELRSNLCWKDAAISTAGITQNSVNYLCRRKSKHSRDLTLL